LPLVRDIFVGCYPSAIGHGLDQDLKRAAIGGFHRMFGRLPVRYDPLNMAANFFGVAFERTGIRTKLDQFKQCQSGLHDLGRQTVNLNVTLIADDNSR
jgi:hypothetical protein